MASRAARWYPSFKVDFKASKDLFRFGGWVFFRDLCRYMANNVDYFFISRYLSTQALGFYTRAFDVMRLPQRRITRAVNSVLFAAFSRVQDQPEKVRAGFQKVVLAVSLVTYPILLGMMVTAPDFVHVVYGQKWVPMVIPLQIMCVAGILRSIDPFLNSVVTATGFVSHAAFRRFLEFGALTLATFIGVKHGIIGVSVAVVIVSVLVMFLMVSLLKRVGAAGWREYLGPQWPALSGSLIMVALMLGLRFLLERIPVPSPVVRLAAMTIVGIPSYLGFLLLVRPKRVTALYEEIAGDIQKVTRKYRKKLAGWFKRLGFAQSSIK